MFVMTMAATFRVGDTAEVRINGEPATLTWRDRHTLVINNRDARRIVMQDTGIDGAGRPVRTFTCVDAQPSITCPVCHRTSYNPQDIENRYCGFCHRFKVPVPPTR